MKNFTPLYLGLLSIALGFSLLYPEHWLLILVIAVLIAVVSTKLTWHRVVVRPAMQPVRRD